MQTVSATSETEPTAKSATQHVELAPQTTKDEETDIETVALVVDAPKADFKLTPIILDQVRPDEVLIDMKYTGICHTDIVLQQGLLPMVEFPAIFGHEGAGTIRALGSAVRDTSLQVGDAVLLSFNTCGTCNACTSGHPAFCHTHPEVNHNAVRISDRSTPARLQDGKAVRSQYFGQSSFSKTSIVNEKCVVKCPDAYKDTLDIYCAMGCGFQTGAGTVLNVLKPTKTDTVVIFGLGSVGLCALMAAKSLGVETIIAVDIVDDKLTLGKTLGASATINSKSGRAVSQIKELTSRGANFSIDCTGLVGVMEEAVECIGPLGTAAIVGVPPGGKNLKIDPLLFLLENKKLVGVIEGDSNPQEFIPQLIEMHQAGHFPVDKLCKTYPISKFEDALADIKSGKVIKPVIAWE